MRSLSRQLASLWSSAGRWSTALMVWCGLALSAFAQESPAPGNEELLLSYRRLASDANAGAAPAGTGSAPAQQPAATENPLRPAADGSATAGSAATPVYRFPEHNSAPTNGAPNDSAAPSYGAPAGYGEMPAVEPAAPQPAPPATQPVVPMPPTDAQSSPDAVMVNPVVPPDPQDSALLRYQDSALQRTAHEEAAPQAPTAPPAKELAEPKSAPVAPETAEGALPLPVEHDENAYAPTTTAAPDESRRLAPRSSLLPEVAAALDPESTGDGQKSRLPISFSNSKFESLTTAGAGLAVVVGLFFVCMWLLRRGSGAKQSGTLPNDAFAVLGRAPLTPQSFAQLLRVGNKLVLVAVSADGIHPLTEVIDPLEVDRLTAVCSSGKGHGPAAEFQQVLAQLAREPARGFLGAEAANGGGRRRA